jgi:hypothetical protein
MRKHEWANTVIRVGGAAEYADDSGFGTRLPEAHCHLPAIGRGLISPGKALSQARPGFAEDAERRFADDLVHNHCIGRVGTAAAGVAVEPSSSSPLNM